MLLITQKLQIQNMVNSYRMIKVASISIVKAIAKIIDWFDTWFGHNHFTRLWPICWSCCCQRCAMRDFRDDRKVFARILKIRLVIVECWYGLCDYFFLTDHSWLFIMTTTLLAWIWSSNSTRIRFFFRSSRILSFLSNTFS